MTQPILYIVAGANGSGKTTFALRFIELNGLQFINADEIAKEISPDDLRKADMAAGRHFFKEFEDVLESKRSFVIESTLSGKTLATKISRAKEFGYQIKIIYLFLDDPKVNIDRVKMRVLSGGHHIPDGDIIRRFDRSKINFWTLYKDLSDSWELFYNADENFQLISMGTNSEYEIFDEILMQEFLKGVANAR